MRGGVAVGAVGAVAFGAVYVGGRHPLSVLPAARADAEPGTCGSDIGLLPDGRPRSCRSAAAVDRRLLVQEDPAAVPPQGTHLGTLVGRTMSPVLVRELSPGARDAAVADLVRGAQGDAGRGGGSVARAVMADPPDAAPLTAGQVDALDRGVEVARQQLESAQTSEPLSGIDDELDSQILITHDGTVVASDADPSPDPQYSWMSSPDRSVVIEHDEHGAEHLRDGRGPRGRAVARAVSTRST